MAKKRLFGTKLSPAADINQPPKMLIRNLWLRIALFDNFVLKNPAFYPI